MRKIMILGGLIFLLGIAFVSADSCTDSDGGKNSSVYGTVTWSNTSGSGTISDYCVSNSLMEMFCHSSSSSYIISEYITCDSGSCNLGACVVVTTETNCNDGLDDDGDGSNDCDDSDCASDSACIKTENCNNYVDDDGDGTVDKGGLDTDGDGDIEYLTGCVNSLKIFKQSFTSSTICVKGSNYKCKDVSTAKINTCPTGTYISADTDCTSIIGPVTYSAPEVEEEMGFWAKLWAWITGT